MSTFSKIISILTLVFIDQISKYWILSFLELGESFNLLPFLDLTLIFNSGIAFGLLDNLGNLGSWLLYLLVTSIIIYFTYFNSNWSKPRPPLNRASNNMQIRGHKSKKSGFFYGFVEGGKAGGVILTPTEDPDWTRREYQGVGRKINKK